MNTKTTKFLAVLAVFAMAFAGLAILVNADSNDAAEATTEKTITADDTLVDGKKYGVDLSTATGNITLTVPTGAANATGITLYVVPGDSKTLTLNSGNGAATVAVTIYVASAASGTSATYDDTYVVKFAATAEAASVTHTSGAMTVASGKITSAAVPTLTTTTPYKESGTTVEFLKDGSTTYYSGTETVVFPAGFEGSYTVSSTTTDAKTTAVATATVAKPKDVTVAGTITFTIGTAATGDMKFAITGAASTAAFTMVKGSATLVAASGTNYAFSTENGSLNFVADVFAQIASNVFSASRTIYASGATVAPLSNANPVVFYGTASGTVTSSATDADLDFQMVNSSGTVSVTNSATDTHKGKWTVSGSSDDPVSAVITPNNGTAAISEYSEGSITISGSDFEFVGTTITAGSITVGTATKLNVITNAIVLTKGDLNVRANATVTTAAGVTLTKGKLTIESGATLTVGGALTMTSGDLLVRGTLELGGDMTITGNADVYGTIKSNDTTDKTIYVGAVDKKAENAVKFVAKSGSSLIYIKVQKATGQEEWTNITIDISGAVSTVYLHGTISTSQKYGQTQNVVVDGDLEIKDNAKIEIFGGFQVQSGVRMTITSGTVEISGDGVDVNIDGILDVDGTFTVAKTAKSVKINGTLNNDGKVEIKTANVVISKDGEFAISDTATETTIDAITVAAGGLLKINGPITGTSTAKITNKGAVSMNGALLSKNLKIVMDGDKSTVAIISALNATSEPKTITITDNGMTCGTYKQTNNSQITITLGGAKNDGVSGLLVTQAITTNATKSTITSKMTLSGGFAAVEHAATLEIDTYDSGKANFAFADEFVVGPMSTLNIKYETTIDKTMYISGTTGKEATLKGTAIVTGVIYANKDAIVTGFAPSAAKFTGGTLTEPITYFASIENAMEILKDTTDAKTVEILGEKTVVKSNVTIPANITLNGDKFTIGTTTDNEVTMTVLNGATIKTDLTIVVLGTLYLEHGKDLKTTKVTADVKSTDGTDLCFTNLYTALENADPLDVIEVTADKLNFVKDVTVPEGVVLLIPAGVETTFTAANKITITVNGVMICNGIEGYFDEKATETKAALKVNGTFMTSESTASEIEGKVAAVYTHYSTAGAYYFISDLTGDYVYISSLETASLTDVKKIYICGDVTEDAEVTLGEGKELSIYGEASLTVSDLNLMKSKVKILTAGELNGFISAPFGADGTTVVKVSKLNIGYIESAYDTTDKVFSMVLDQIGGDVTVLSGVLSTDAALTMDKDSSLNVAEDAALYIPDKGNVILAGNALIYGTIVVAGDLNIASKNVVVEGTIMVSYSEEDKIDGYLEISAITLVNGDIIVADGAVCKITETIAIGSEPSGLGSTAVISGDITLTNGKAIIAYPGADVSEMTIGKKAPLSTEFYINDELYMTAYCGSNAATVASVIAVPEYDIPELEEGAATKLKDVKTWEATSTTVIGDEDELYAEIDYATVTITTSWANGLALYIDGARIMSPTTELTVGIYVITASVNAGYACDNITITFNGVALPVTKEGTLLTIGVEDKDSILAVSGDVYIPEPEPVTPEEKSEWTITTILLVVLVILIAIMAVIVALRLNRS